MVHKVISKNTSISVDDNSQCIYHTIQSAVDHASPGDIVEIAKGKYEEKLYITTSGLTFQGENSEACIITYGDYARKEHEDGKEYGTFRSYTCLVLANDVIFKNLTIENSAGDGRKVGQAVALYSEGDRLQFRNCRLIGYQDTLFTGPLPPKPIIPGSFVGPTEDRPYERSRQYFYDCYIIGDVDFIFGSALTVFNRCQLVTRNRHEDINGFVTAPSTWEGEPYGFVFIDCDLSGEDGIAPETVFFGRPWRPYGQTMLVRCSYDDSIHNDHWDPWGKESNRETARFSEYGCWGTSLPLKEDKIDKEQLDESSFIIRKTEIPEMDFLNSWHKEMLQSDK